MAEPLKNSYGPEIPQAIARMIAAVHRRFDAKAFVRDAVKGYDALELMQRGERIADALHAHLPRDYAQAVEILLASLDQPTGLAGKNAMSSFLFLPHTLFVAKHGLDGFNTSMRAQHALTQRFTAEFSLRKFIQINQILALNRLQVWARDPSEHVRRAVSESTRTRLPWASRLREFMRDPRPVLDLLELLKDDPSLYVRRSVANNLNDISKDHPRLLIETAQRWWQGADENRRWVIRHALRSAVKRGDAAALRVLGFEGAVKAAVKNASVAPARVKKGGVVSVTFEVVNAASREQRLVVDLAVVYVKANGATSRKVFKLRTLTLAAKARAAFAKRLSLADLTTRKHYPGAHRVEAVFNGKVAPLGVFELLER
ncbi:MAG: DNA alkylation repair protein [Betaproteobacteria bacterium]|nr:DNA alkylation repair protein [Betaproteobacteria bacterium]